MRLERLRLTNFRNYTDLEIELHPKINLIIGNNAQGKSNILEAIALSLSGESFRAGKNSEFINSQSEPRNGHIQLDLLQKSSAHRIDLHLSEEKKESFLDKKKASKIAFKSRFSVVIFSPDSLSAIKLGPNERRALLDDILFSTKKEKIRLFYEYSRCLKTRNSVLKSRLAGKIDEEESQSVLESILPSYLNLAAAMTNARIQIIKDILPRVKSLLKSLLNENGVDISVDYVISGKSAIDWSQNQVYDALKMRLGELYKAELVAGQSLIGPHKHDIRFILKGKDARYYASQGQQRAVVLAFKIAHIMQHYEINNEYPVLLLDDVFSELDSEKRGRLLKILTETPAQIFITATELDDENTFSAHEKTVFEIVDGNLNTGWI